LEAISIAEILAENKAQLSTLTEHQGLGEDVFWRFWMVGQEDLNGCIEYLKTQTTILAPMTGTRWARLGIWYAGQVEYKPGNANPIVASGSNGLMWILYQQVSKGDKVITITESCAAYTKTRILHTYNPAIPSGAALNGQIIAVQATPTELGRERTVQETTVPKDQVATAYDRSKAEDNTKVMHTENATPLTQPVDLKGTMVRQSAQPTDAGNQRTVQETIVPKDQTAVSVDNSPSQVATKTLHTENATDLTPAAIVKGRLTMQEAQPTAAGNQRTVESVIVPTDQVATSYDRSKAADNTKVLHTENATPLTQPADVKGTIVRQSAQPTPAGNDRTTVETIVPKDQVETSYEQNAFESVDTILHTENDAALPDPTPAAGYVKKNQNIPTEAGNARTQQEIRTAIPQTVGPFISFISDDSTGTIEKGHHADAMPVITAVAAADVILDGDMDDFQKFGYTKRVVTSNVPLSCPGITQWVTKGNSYRINNLQWSTTEERFYYTSYWIYQEAVHHGIAFYLTADAAAAALPTICAAIGGVNVDHGSHVSKAGNNLWLATVQSRNDILISTTTGLEPVWM
jgi:hypothetical protein